MDFYLLLTFSDQVYSKFNFGEVPSPYLFLHLIPANSFERNVFPHTRIALGVFHSLPIR